MLAALLLATTLSLDAPIQQAMRDTGTTAFGIAVVKDDRVLYQRTFGGERFYLASTPKSMTGSWRNCSRTRRSSISMRR